jgi:hypothetical protein
MYVADCGKPASGNVDDYPPCRREPRKVVIYDAPTTPAPVGPALSVDANAGVRAISPNIYGMNFAPEALAKELRIPVSRWGGNFTTRYNWKLDTANRASDWYFENLPEDNPNPAALPNGSAVDRFVEQGKRTGTSSLITVPMIGWTPKSRAVACSFSIAKYGPQQQHAPDYADCGNGVRVDGSPVTGNNPADTSIAVNQTFVQDWVRHLTGKYGAAANGGVRYYNLDQEPSLWSTEHRDVHPAPVGYDEIRARTYTYGAAIKAVDPGAKTFGPAEYGWEAYFYSAKDWASGGNWQETRVDRRAHGDVPFSAWYLQQMKLYEQQHHTRILDYFDLHYYPQAPGVSLSPAGSAATQALRLRSTRSLWDPAYADESWIGDKVMLLPRMRDWVQANYPGTRIAVGEYDWGALDHYNGALAEADALGIFGREGADLAALWNAPRATDPVAYAFRVYRNYDGLGHGFGETSVRATSADQGRLAIYAAKRASDGALTMTIINKTSQALTSRVSLANFSPATTAAIYRYSPDNLGAITRQPDQIVAAGGFGGVVPAWSITLVVLPRAPQNMVMLPILDVCGCDPPARTTERIGAAPAPWKEEDE